MKNSYVIECRLSGEFEYTYVDDFPTHEDAAASFQSLKREPNLDYRLIRVLSESLFSYDRAQEKIITGIADL